MTVRIKKVNRNKMVLKAPPEFFKSLRYFIGAIPLETIESCVDDDKVTANLVDIWHELKDVNLENVDD